MRHNQNVQETQETMSLTEKIKQKAKTKREIWNEPDLHRQKPETHVDILWVRLDDVFAELTNYMLIPVGKWQEIVDLLKNRPKLMNEHGEVGGSPDNIERAEIIFRKLRRRLPI